MVSGHVTEKSGYLYIVLQLKDQNGKRNQKWISTHIKAKGNKRRAEEMLQKLRKEYTDNAETTDHSKAIFFDAYYDRMA